MLRDMDMTKFKEMQESDSSLHALWMKQSRMTPVIASAMIILREKQQS